MSQERLKPEEKKERISGGMRGMDGWDLENGGGGMVCLAGGPRLGEDKLFFLLFDQMLAFPPSPPQLPNYPSWTQ